MLQQQRRIWLLGSITENIIGSASEVKECHFRVSRLLADSRTGCLFEGS